MCVLGGMGTDVAAFVDTCGRALIASVHGFVMCLCLYIVYRVCHNNKEPKFSVIITLSFIVKQKIFAEKKFVCIIVYACEYTVLLL